MKTHILTLPDFSPERFTFPFFPFAFQNFPSDYDFYLAPPYYSTFLFAVFFFFLLPSLLCFLCSDFTELFYSILHPPHSSKQSEVPKLLSLL